jgi:hypothetical protein
LIGYSHLKFREVCKKLVHLSRALEGTQELNKPSSRNNLLGTVLPPTASPSEGLQKLQWNVGCSI